MKKNTRWIDLRETPEGYKGLIEYDERGNITMVCYCPFMPIFEEEKISIKEEFPKKTVD